MKTAIEKSVLGAIVTPFTTIVVIDADRLEREVLKGSISDRDVMRLLPFQTSLVGGESHRHIQNDSAYTVETNSHLIREGETLCAKQGETYRLGFSFAERVPTCPGCLAKAKAVIVNHLLGESSITVR
jgi:hypothetical protein